MKQSSSSSAILPHFPKISCRMIHCTFLFGGLLFNDTYRERQWKTIYRNVLKNQNIQNKSISKSETYILQHLISCNRPQPWQWILISRLDNFPCGVFFPHQEAICYPVCSGQFLPEKSTTSHRSHHPIIFIAHQFLKNFRTVQKIDPFFQDPW